MKVSVVSGAYRSEGRGGPILCPAVAPKRVTARETRRPFSRWKFTVQQATCYAFDNVELRVGERRLLIDGRPQPLGARALDVLMTLLARRDRVVSKDELLDAVWPNLVVEQNNVAVQIASLRKLLGASAITTIAGRGYKFSGGTVRTLQVTRDTAAPSAPAALPARDAGAALVGRSADLRRLAERLSNHRVVALTGAPGVGKSRVAQRLLCDVAHRYPQGTVWIDLAPNDSDASICRSIARTLGVGTVREEPLEALVQALRTRKVLIVIDAVEAAPDEVARVVQPMLRRAPGLSFLLVGQMRLRLPDEQVLRLEGLPVPRGETTAREALTYGAVALYAARAAVANPTFVLDDHSVRSVIAMCRALDGIPLAIERAASATGDGQDVLHQALQRSHDLLPERERALLRRLSVFEHDMPLERVLAVAAGEDGALDTWAVLDALTELVDRSLLSVIPGEPPRYRLLDSTRRFASAQLMAAGELAEYQRRHRLAVALGERPVPPPPDTPSSTGHAPHLQSA